MYINLSKDEPRENQGGGGGSEGNLKKTSSFIFQRKGGGRIYRLVCSACLWVCYQPVKRNVHNLSRIVFF